MRFLRPWQVYGGVRRWARPQQKRPGDPVCHRRLDAQRCRSRGVALVSVRARTRTHAHLGLDESFDGDGDGSAVVSALNAVANHLCMYLITLCFTNHLFVSQHSRG